MKFIIFYFLFFFGIIRNQKGDDVIKTAHKVNTQFMKKIAPGAEASNILVGEVECLNKTISAFIRLNQASIMGGLTEVPIPTR